MENFDSSEETKVTEEESVVPQRREAPKTGLDKAVRSVVFGAAALLALANPARGEGNADTTPLKPAGIEQAAKSSLEARKELSKLLTQVSGDQITLDAQHNFVMLCTARITVNGKEVVSPTGYFRLSKDAFEQMALFVQEDFLEKKMGEINDRFNRAREESTRNELLKYIAELGQPIVNESEIPEGLIKKKTVQQIRRNMAQPSTRDDIYPKPEVKTAPDAADFLK